MSNWLRDWWHGYGHADVDLAKLRRRITANRPWGSATTMTSGEYRALVENQTIKNHVDTLRIEGDALRAAREAIRAERDGLKIIDDIFAIRVRNNIPWKRLITIAMKHAPEETKAALREINANDRAISDLMSELAK